MNLLDFPYVTWMPADQDAPAWVWSKTKTMKANTREVLMAYLTATDPDDILMRFRITSGEFLVAILYELAERRRNIAKHDTFRLHVLDWARLGMSQLANHEPVSWPPPSVSEYLAGSR